MHICVLKLLNRVSPIGRTISETYNIQYNTMIMIKLTGSPKTGVKNQSLLLFLLLA